MKNIMKLVLLTVGCVFLAIGGIAVGYYQLSGNRAVQKPAVENNIANVLPEEVATVPPVPAVEPPFDNPEASSEPAADPENRIGSTTEIVYEYVYDEDGTVERTTEEAPYFLIGLTRLEIEDLFSDWQLTEFSPNQVVMRKSLAGKSAHHYIVGVSDGFLTVFYDTPINGSNIKEITDTPINSLSPDEQERLRSGIPVDGDAALAQILEDYGS